ncbi:MAG: Zn-ribbon domain-containing OB-fold protein [Mycobacteriaceae bacterium]
MTFSYTRSTGPVIGAFLTGLRDHCVLGIRGTNGKVHVPPVEYDPDTSEALSEFVQVSSIGTVTTWTWQGKPIAGQPLDIPFAWALIILDGADTALLHVVNVPSAEVMHTGMRVGIYWSDNCTGSISDIAYFLPITELTLEQSPTAVKLPPVTMITTPVDLTYTHTASAEESNFLRGLNEGKIFGGKTDAKGKVYVPPRAASPVDGRPTSEQVELPDHGIVTTYCIVNVPFLGQRIKPPYIAAYILLEGADIPFLHLVLECTPEEIHMGMKVQAVWKPEEQWGYSLENIDHFRPSGEADADYHTYKQHL